MLPRHRGEFGQAHCGGVERWVGEGLSTVQALVAGSVWVVWAGRCLLNHGSSPRQRNTAGFVCDKVGEGGGVQQYLEAGAYGMSLA